MGVVHFKLPQVDGSSTFMSQVNLDSLETINSKEVLKAHLTDIRDDSPDIRVVGNVINTLPISGTKLSMEFEEQTYTLETKENQVIVTEEKKEELTVFSHLFQDGQELMLVRLLQRIHLLYLVEILSLYLLMEQPQERLLYLRYLFI